MEVIDADLSSIGKDLSLEDLDQLLGALDTVDVGVHEAIKRQHAFAVFGILKTHGRPRPTALTPRASSLMTSLP